MRMRNPAIAAALAAVLLAAISCTDKKPIAKEQKADEMTELQKVSYGMGVDVANKLREKFGDDLDLEALAAGARDGLSGVKHKVGEEAFEQTFEQYSTRRRGEIKARLESEAAQNKADGEAFMKENAKKEGVKTTSSGVQYKVINEGTGKSPGSKDDVVIHYNGTLLDGTVFDSSFKRGEPLTINIGSLIPGLAEALKLMKTGAKWQVFVPSKLAYAEKAPSEEVGMNTTLIFEVELLEVR